MEPRSRIDPRDVLSALQSFPDESAEARLQRLVGLDDHAEILARDLHLLWHPHLARQWSDKHYGNTIPLVGLLGDLVPLIVLEGDVGTGKTALAETIGHRIAQRRGYPVKLIKMSTQVRGTGYVGEMGTLLAGAFKHVESLWRRESCPIMFVVDEADSLLSTRAAAQMHHEDKSGVNTILQHLDGLGRSGAQIAVIAITNRIGILDPAVRRRATRVLTFTRPGAKQRRALFDLLFAGAKLTDRELGQLVTLSEPKEHPSSAKALPFNYADLTLRFALPALREAIDREEAIAFYRLETALRELIPTPPMESG